MLNAAAEDGCIVVVGGGGGYKGADNPNLHVTRIELALWACSGMLQRLNLGLCKQDCRCRPNNPHFAQFQPIT